MGFFSDLRKQIFPHNCLVCHKETDDILMAYEGDPGYEYKIYYHVPCLKKAINNPSRYRGESIDLFLELLAWEEVKQKRKIEYERARNESLKHFQDGETIQCPDCAGSGKTKEALWNPIFGPKEMPEQICSRCGGSGSI